MEVEKKTFTQGPTLTVTLLLLWSYSRGEMQYCHVSL